MLRYSALVPQFLYSMDPNNKQFKCALKNWVKENIDKQGDHIFRGRIISSETDWLLQELELWKKGRDHEYQSLLEFQEVESENEDQ